MNGPKVAAVILGGLVLQLCLFGRFSYEGARPDLMILIAIAAAYVGGPDRGAIVGFASGLAYDIVLTTPLGLSALVYLLVGYGVGSVTAGILRSSRWVGSAVAAGASAAGMLLYATIGTLFGQNSFEGPSFGAILVVVAVVNALLAPLAIRAMRWAAGEGHDRPSRSRRRSRIGFGPNPRLHRPSRFPVR